MDLIRDVKISEEGITQDKGNKSVEGVDSNSIYLIESKVIFFDKLM